MAELVRTASWETPETVTGMVSLAWDMYMDGAWGSNFNLCWLVAWCWEFTSSRGIFEGFKVNWGFILYTYCILLRNSYYMPCMLNLA